MTTGRVAVPAPEQLPFSNDRDLPEADTPSSPEAGDGDRCAWPRVGKSPAATEVVAAKAPPPATLRASDWCPQDIVDEWGVQSFPASDPPANW